MARLGLEGGTTPGLGWLEGTVSMMHPKGGLKIPHMGGTALTSGLIMPCGRISAKVRRSISCIPMR